MSGFRPVPLDPRHLGSGSATIPLTIAESSRYARFRTAEVATAQERAPDLDEMIEVTLGERDRIERSVRAAEAAYGAPFDAREVRKCAVLQRTAEFLGRIHQHKDEVREVLQPKVKPRRRV